MTEGINNNLVPLAKGAVMFLYRGAVFFYPVRARVVKKGERKIVPDYWPEGGYREAEFSKFLLNMVGGENIDQAVDNILKLKASWDKGEQPHKTIPKELNDLVVSMDEYATEEKILSPYDKRNRAKKALLESEKHVEKTTSTTVSKIETSPSETLEEKNPLLNERAIKEDKISSDEAQTPTKETFPESQKQVEESISTERSIPTIEPEIETSLTEIISKAAGPLTIFAGKILTAPFRAATYLSGPTTYSGSGDGEGPGVATARYMLTHGITSSSIRGLENRAQQLGITPSQLQNLASLIKIEQEAHPFISNWVSVIYSGQQASLSQAQISSLLVPSGDGSTATLPRKSFIGNVFGRIWQRVLGKLASKGLKTVGKKVAPKMAAKAVAQATATVVAPGVGNVFVKIGLFLFEKFKDLVSYLKTKEGKETVLAYLFGAMMISGIFLGGTLGAALVVGGLVPGLGSLAAKAGGFGPLGANVGSYGRAFMSGVTGVVFPALAGPLIISIVCVPVLIAIVLFIINSGAYLVPPKPLSESSFIGFPIECTTEKIPVSFSRTTSSPISTRAWEITSDLYQGFWCYWNRSPGDIAEDITLYPPSYPDLFNEAFFNRNPFPTRDEASTCGNCLFWCTYLVQKAYRETGHTNIKITLWSPTMYDDFLRRGKIIKSSDATPQNVVAGSVVFFQVLSGPDRINHVGVVHSTSSDNISYLQSNAPTKEGSLTFRSSGKGIQDLPGISVIGIGLP